MFIDETGAYQTDDPKNHCFDRPLADAIAGVVQGTLVDLGCGLGKYVKHFTAKGIDTFGYDGNRFCRHVANCHVHNLINPLTCRRDWVMCLEVGEHMPPEYAEQLVDTIVANSKVGAIVSWAIPGQGGRAHVNELPNKDVVAMMEARGMLYDTVVSASLRDASSLRWFKNTVMVFVRPE